MEGPKLNPAKDLLGTVLGVADEGFPKTLLLPICDELEPNRPLAFLSSLG